MQQDLEMLLKLQVIDYDLGELERSKEYLPDMMQNLNREVAEATQKLRDTTKQLTDAKVRQKSLEIEIKAKEGELAKYQHQMMSIKTNKEYDALVAEIDAIKGAISARETELLETMTVVTNLDKEIGAIQERESQIRENNAKQLQILQEKIDSIGSKVSGKIMGRQEIIAAVSRPSLSTYERVRKGRGGRVVVLVRKRACSACFKALTPKKVQEIKRGDQIITCDNCGCMLYWDESESN